MSESINRQFLLASRPSGEPTAENFDFVETPVPEPGDGQILVRTIYLSLDPYMRGRMNDARSYVEPVKIGAVMEGGIVGQVVKSRNAKFTEGEFVNASLGWQEYAVSDGRGVRKVDPALGPLSTAVGVLGMPAMTAYTGMKNIGKPREGETLVVAAASGAVGALVGQIARIHGCRVVGIAGSDDKCRYVVEELGFDACLSHRDPDLRTRLKQACPDGVDIYWENVGGPVFKAVMPLLNDFGRIPVCGIISHYNDTGLSQDKDYLPMLEGLILRRRLTMRGLIVFDFHEDHKEFLNACSGWLREGRLKFREDFVDGLENAPQAFFGLLKGENFGKLVVRVSPDPLVGN
ncbi:MAG: NADP-dependent oxidoreductase [Candidatus Rariloculaceae bacterium]